MVTPLTCLLDLNGYGEEIRDPERISSQWFDYKITPMATNLQFVFYRNKANDVLVKVLLNENEATLPIKAFKGPYYRWTDVRAYMNNIVGKIIKK